MQTHEDSRDTHAYKRSIFSSRYAPAPMPANDCCVPANLLKGSHLLVHCLLWCWG